MGRRKSTTARPAKDRAAHDDGSIGSALSLKDQFDILVPINIPDRTKSDKDHQSDVSSITTDEHKKMLKYLISTQARRSGLCNSPMALCCCTEMTSNPIKTNPGIDKKKKKKNGLGRSASVDKTCDVSRSQYSLFDALSDEDSDEEDIVRTSATDDQAADDSPIKRKRSWRKSIRKKMPWASKK